MAIYVKKPIAIEAIQYTGGNYKEIYDFIGDIPPATTSDCKIIIHTLEGTMTGDVGDWIIKGINGEFYPCKPDIFEKTYNPANLKTPKEKVEMETFLLDVTNDNGASYSAVAICSSVEKAGAVIQRIFTKYNNEFAPYNKRASYDETKWQNIQEDYHCYPLGPGAEYRVRKFEVDDTSFLVKPKLKQEIFDQALEDAEKQLIKEVENQKIVN